MDIRQIVQELCAFHDEPYQNYLARNLSPSINFSFQEGEIDGKRVVVLMIPAATEIPTAFKEKRYIRILLSVNCSVITDQKALY
ncbi:MAG: ATP-binding protein [Lachnospiraceae bacterium]|nr:ATP-binding protein [Lachnospiraceae bacterium]